MPIFNWKFSPFDTRVAPVTDEVRLDLFTPGSPGSITASILTPNACVVNGICAGSETCSNCPADCAGQGGGAGCCGNLTCEPGENPCRCAPDCGTQTAFELVCNDAIDNDFKNTDVVIVIGANDVVNPAAKTNPQSPLFGMPVLSVEEAKIVFVIKRSLGAGFAGVKNELFELANTRMIYADAKKACEELAKALKDS